MDEAKRGESIDVRVRFPHATKELIILRFRRPNTFYRFYYAVVVVVGKKHRFCQLNQAKLWIISAKWAV